MDSSNLAATPTPEIARCLGVAASLSNRAIVVGNRAGIVEWANAAWTRITGFPLDETLAKPITHFLEQTSIELELVDVVAQSYLDGRPCTIEFPFETFDDREIWVHLEVQPIRNAQGEITDFVAVATDVSERRQQELDSAENATREHAAPGSHTTEDPAIARMRPHSSTRLSLSAEVEVACERESRSNGARTSFDLDLDTRLPSTSCDRRLLGETIRHLLDAATTGTDENWGFVTVMTGITRRGRSHTSAAHPIAVRPAALAKAAFLYLEVHDTGAALAPSDLDAIEAGKRTDDPRANALSIAKALAATLGGSLHIDSTPGCGTQSLLLLPLPETVDLS